MVNIIPLKKGQNFSGGKQLALGLPPLRFPRSRQATSHHQLSVPQLWQHNSPEIQSGRMSGGKNLAPKGKGYVKVVRRYFLRLRKVICQFLHIYVYIYIYIWQLKKKTLLPLEILHDELDDFCLAVKKIPLQEIPSYMLKTFGNRKESSPHGDLILIFHA